MAVYYKFQSEKNYKSICVDQSFITLSNLKDRIFHSRYGKRGTDLDIQITNAYTNQEYNDEAMLIPKCTTLLVRRTPKHFRSRLIPDLNKLKADAFRDVSSKKDVSHAESSKLEDEFGPEIYSPLHEQTPVQPSNAIQSNPIPTTPGSYLQSRADKGFGPARGGRTGLSNNEWNKPPPGYVCHRCKEPGHFIQHCPTNRNPDYDVRSYSSPNSVVAPVKLNERISTTTYSEGEIPPELNCLLCKQVMTDAVLTRKCCFNSYCDKCIRDYIISKSICACGAKDILADDLIPNKTLRDTITRILESSSSSSSGCYKGTSQLQDKEELQKKVSMNATSMQPPKYTALLSNKRKAEYCQPRDMKKHVEYESSIDEDERHFKRWRMVKA